MSPVRQRSGLGSTWLLPVSSRSRFLWFWQPRPVSARPRHRKWSRCALWRIHLGYTSSNFTLTDNISAHEVNVYSTSVFWTVVCSQLLLYFDKRVFVCERSFQSSVVPNTVIADKNIFFSCRLSCLKFILCIFTTVIFFLQKWTKTQCWLTSWSRRACRHSLVESCQPVWLRTLSTFPHWLMKFKSRGEMKKTTCPPWIMQSSPLCLKRRKMSYWTALKARVKPPLWRSLLWTGPKENSFKTFPMSSISGLGSWIVFMRRSPWRR